MRASVALFLCCIFANKKPVLEVRRSMFVPVLPILPPFFGPLTIH